MLFFHVDIGRKIGDDVPRSRVARLGPLSRAIRGDVTAQSASGPKARRIMRRVVQTLIRFDYEIQKRQRARKYAYFMRGDQIEEDVTMKRRMHEEDSMARMFREQLGKSLATYSTMCAERARYVSTEEKAEVLAYRLLLRLSAKIEDSTFSSSSFSSSPSSSKLDNIDFRAAEPDVLSSQLVLRAMRVSVCGDTGKYVSFFRAVSSESFTLEEFCCVSPVSTRSAFDTSYVRTLATTE